MTTAVQTRGGLLVDAWERIGEVQTCVEVGAGYNLLPALPVRARVHFLSDVDPGVLEWLHGETASFAPEWLEAIPLGIERAWQAVSNVQIARASVYDLGRECWDVVSMHEVAECVTDDRQCFGFALGSIEKALKPDGFLVATFKLGGELDLDETELFHELEAVRLGLLRAVTLPGRIFLVARKGIR